MRKVTVILLGVMVVCGIVAFKAWNMKPATLHQQPASQVEVKPQPEISVVPTPALKPELSVAEKMRLAHQQMDEGMAKLRLSSTPEIRAAIRKRQLEKTHQEYEAFFQSLELEEGATHQALDIILERENKYLDIYDTLSETGFSKGIKAFGESRKVEQSVAEVQLRHLLGDERYDALTQFEKERQSQIQIQAKKIVSKHLND